MYRVSIELYKITNIVRTLWLAKRRACMRVCKHGSDVKIFAGYILGCQIFETEIKKWTKIPQISI